MTFKSSSDAIVDALRTLLQAGVNAKLATEVGEDEWRPVRQTYQAPIPRRLISSLQLPMIACYRGRSSTAGRVGLERRWLTPFHVDYILDEVPLHSLPETWPVLHRVHQACIEALLEDCGSGASTLAAVDVRDVHDAELLVNYGYASDDKGANVYPMFSATWPMTHPGRPIEVDETVLPPLSFRASFKTQGDEDPEPLLQEDGTGILLENGEPLYQEDGEPPKTLATTLVPESES